MLFGTLRTSSAFLKENSEGFRTTSFGEMTLIVNNRSATPRGIFETTESKFAFTSEKPYLKDESGYRIIDSATEPLHVLSPKAENNFAAFEVMKSNEGWSGFASSARITRARTYFLFVDGGILWSDDLRELIPYSTREMNPMGAFSILKYGDVPEYITVIKGIFCVPVGQCLKFNEKDFDAWLSKREIPREAFEFYFNLDFPMDGGDLPKTEKLMEAEFEFVSTLNPIVPVSGGVDSTLANCLIDKFIDKPYPAYYIQFGQDDPELKFAQDAAKATKAELEIALFQPEDTIPSFEYQKEHAIQPIGESSTISTAYHFMRQGHEGHKII
ncbi:MAG: asparagine synthase-related protein, partial [Flavobacteriales bacterium]